MYIREDADSLFGHNTKPDTIGDSETVGNVA